MANEPKGVDISSKALTCFLFSLGSAILCPIAAPLAWLYAAKISTEDMTDKDKNFVKIAKVIAIFMTIILALGFAFMLFAIVIAVAIPGFMHYVDAAKAGQMQMAIEALDALSDQVDSFTDQIDSLKMIFGFYF